MATAINFTPELRSLLELAVAQKQCDGLVSPTSLGLALSFLLRDHPEPSAANLRILINFLYWHPSGVIRPGMIADAIGRHQGSLTRGDRLVDPITVNYYCWRCRRRVPTELKTRPPRKNPYDAGARVCDPCEEKERQRRYPSLYRTPSLERPAPPALASADSRINELATMPYPDYLLTPEWQATRLDRLKFAGYRCQLCYASDRPLHVHHRTYERRGRELPSDLVVLCDVCHETFHDRLKLDPASYQTEARS